jgi:hypothetical protein
MREKGASDYLEGQPFPHTGNDRHFLGFAACQQRLIGCLQDRIVTHWWLHRFAKPCIRLTDLAFSAQS